MYEEEEEKTFDYDPEQESVEEYLSNRYIDATPSADESALIAEKKYETGYPEKGDVHRNSLDRYNHNLEVEKRRVK